MEQYYFASPERIEELKKQVCSAGLDAPDAFFMASREELRACYNGVGPDRWSSRFRAFVTKLLQWFEPEAMIHDWEYTYQPKTYFAFTIANLRLLYNGVKFALFTQGWTKMALQQAKRAAVLALLCQLFGWGGYKQATPIYNKE